MTGGAPIAVTHTDVDTRYADFVFDEPRARLIAVGERPGEKERENCLIAIDVRTGTTTDLHRGHDFYSAPRLSPDKRRLCFLSWDHPNMPWDGTQLHVATLTDDGALTDDTIIAGGIAESIVQPEWLTADRILFASDQNGFWNLYSYDSSGIYCVYPDEAEYSGPAWGFGSKYYCVLGPRHVIAQRMHKGATNLLIIDVDNAMATPLRERLAGVFRHCAAAGSPLFRRRQSQSPCDDYVDWHSTANPAKRSLKPDGSRSIRAGFRFRNRSNIRRETAQLLTRTFIRRAIPTRAPRTANCRRCWS